MAKRQKKAKRGFGTAHVEVRYVDKRGLAKYVSTSDRTIESWLRAGFDDEGDAFPRAIAITKRHHRWDLVEVDQYLDRKRKRQRGEVQP